MKLKHPAASTASQLPPSARSQRDAGPSSSRSILQTQAASTASQLLPSARSQRDAGPSSSRSILQTQAASTASQLPPSARSQRDAGPSSSRSILQTQAASIASQLPPSARSWLVKQEPSAYSFSQFQKEKITAWTGVRNFQARNNLRAMQRGDRVLYYHSNEDRAIVGLAEVVKTAYPDPTATEGDWSCVDLKAIRAFAKPLTLPEIKTDPVLQQIGLIRQSRLSVMPVSEAEMERILKQTA